VSILLRPVDCFVLCFERGQCVRVCVMRSGKPIGSAKIYESLEVEAVALGICRLGKRGALAAPCRLFGLTWIHAAIATAMGL
jgi:hypothetical protein